MLYTDNLILIDDNENDLKLQINLLGNFTDKYKMEINPKKTKVTIFHENKDITPNGTVFASIGEHQIKVANQCKHLGVILDNKDSFKNHVDILVEKAGECIYSMLAKNKEWKGFKPRLLLHLFGHLIAPVVSYGCEIWGNQERDEIKTITYFSANLFWELNSQY